MLTHEINTIHNQGISVIVLNAVENAIERYGHAHRGFISNAYEWFSLKLGYKNSKFLYRVFQQRRDAKLGYRDIMVILKITQDQDLLKAITEDLDITMRVQPESPNQLKFL